MNEIQRAEDSGIVVELFSQSNIDVERIFSAQETPANDYEKPINQLQQKVDFGETERLVDLKELRRRKEKCLTDAAEMKRVVNSLRNFGSIGRMPKGSPLTGLWSDRFQGGESQTA